MSEVAEKRKVLILSSLRPDKSAGLGADVMSSLVKGGYEVDFLTLWSSSEGISLKSSAEVLRLPASIASQPCKKPSFFKRFFRRFRKKKVLKKLLIVHADESKPPVDPRLITDRITKSYDFVIVLFWQGMLTAETLGAVYAKTKSPIFVLAVDMFPFTGGCFYFWDCRGFIERACTKCPALELGEEDCATNRNFLHKQNVYHTIRCLFLGNSWMRHYIEQAPIIEQTPVRECFLVVDESVFSIRDKQTVRVELGLDRSEGLFFIFTGAPSLSEERKGFVFLRRAVEVFIRGLSSEDRSRVILLIAGRSTERLQDYFDVRICELGFLDRENLAKAYNAADVYVSPSIEDAGPSMVNQSLMSGTPVVAFDTGVAQDIVITGETGYKARMADAEDFAEGIRSIYVLGGTERLKVQKKCRDLAVSLFSYDAFSDRIRRYDDEFCR